MSSRGQLTLLLAAVALLSVIAVAVTYPYYIAYRMRRAATAATDQAIAHDLAALRTLSQLSPRIVAARPFRQVQTLPEPAFESSIDVAVLNSTPEEIRFATGKLLVATFSGDRIAAILFSITTPVRPHSEVMVSTIVRSPFTYPTAGMKCWLDLDSIVFADGRTVRKP